MLYVHRAQLQGYGLVVLNWNEDKYQTPIDHILKVWDQVVEANHIQHVAIVAHSAGGQLIVDAAGLNATIRQKTFAVAFTDSHLQTSTSRDRLVNYTFYFL